MGVSCSHSIQHRYWLTERSHDKRKAISLIYMIYGRHHSVFIKFRATVALQKKEPQQQMEHVGV